MSDNEDFTQYLTDDQVIHVLVGLIFAKYYTIPARVTVPNGEKWPYTYGHSSIRPLLARAREIEDLTIQFIYTELCAELGKMVEDGDVRWN